MTFTNTDTRNCESNFCTLWILSCFTSCTFTLLVFTVSLSHFEKRPFLPHTLPHRSVPYTLPSLFLLFYYEFSVSLELGRVVQGLGRGGLWAYSWSLMNGGCLWLLGEESSFNMSLERGPGRLYWSRVGRYVRDGVWQEETVGHRKEWWPWKTQIHRLPLGNKKLSKLCGCECRAHIADAGSTNDCLHL